MGFGETALPGNRPAGPHSIADGVVSCQVPGSGAGPSAAPHSLAPSCLADSLRPDMASSLSRAFFVVSLCASIYCVSPSSAPSKGPPQPSSRKHAPTSQVSSSNTNFAFRLYRKLVSQTSRQNVFFSPASISTSLAMLSLGARAATKTQILQSMGFDLAHTPESAVHRGFQHMVRALGGPSGGLDLKMGSALFVRKELRLQKRFLDDVERLYESQVFSTDFSNASAARQRINSYVEQETQGKVVDLIQGLEPRTAMVLANHIFFKGKALGGRFRF